MLEEKKDALLPAVTGNARLLRSLLAEVAGENMPVISRSGHCHQLSFSQVYCRAGVSR